MNSTKRFQRCKEDFICARCQSEVLGDGYTNHCPSCLWSRHVDVNPGDRAHDCQGLMEPVSIEHRGQKRLIIHRCTRCGATRRNRVADADSMEALLAIAAGGSMRVRG